MPDQLRNGIASLGGGFLLAVLLWALAVFVPSTPEGLAKSIAAAAGLLVLVGGMLTVFGVLKWGVDKLRNRA